MVQSNFRVEVTQCGCFGCGRETVTAFKNKGKRWLRVVSDSDEPDSYELTPEKETQFEMLLNRIIAKNGRGGCTTWVDSSLKILAFALRYLIIAACVASFKKLHGDLSNFQNSLNIYSDLFR